MNIQAMIDQVKRHPEAEKIGMILCHNGVVRATARDGRAVSGLRIAVDHEKLREVVAEKKKTPGIVEILVEIVEGKDLAVGDDVMGLVVAGDIRETVIAVLRDTLETIKTVVTQKRQYFVE
ncbi:molybdenum cofactor biosynthesis protein MoaE [Desulfatirhabdium butyrativorans]|uniref:molybdenum cofactor biosynthesis protein MoaE n=1 Tax=Desulfatirhabdium butyrativorans TaxID=340467 RepID=UPI00048583B6|nr:molybdenum cofactor biosynthesis protein MoaE [Desulfatirhabdium butyrativorans]